MKNDFLRESHAAEIDKLCDFHNFSPWLDRATTMLEVVQSVIVRGVIRCSVPGDAQAHAEVTVGGDGNLLTVEVNGSFIDVLLPKGHGVYHK